MHKIFRFQIVCLCLGVFITGSVATAQLTVKPIPREKVTVQRASSAWFRMAAKHIASHLFMNSAVQSLASGKVEAPAPGKLWEAREEVSTKMKILKISLDESDVKFEEKETKSGSFLHAQTYVRVKTEVWHDLNKQFVEQVFCVGVQSQARFTDDKKTHVFGVGSNYFPQRARPGDSRIGRRLSFNEKEKKCREVLE